MGRGTQLALLLLLALSIQTASAAFFKVKYFGGSSHGCKEDVDGFVESDGYEVPVPQFAKYAHVCFPGGKKYSPLFHSGNIRFVSGHQYTKFVLHTGAPKDAEVKTYHNKKSHEWLMNIGNNFQLVIRDCAIIAIYNTDFLDSDAKESLGLAPYGTFHYPDPQLQCCGPSCQDDSCPLEEGYSKGLKALFYPKPDYGCSPHPHEHLLLPSDSFFRRTYNLDRQTPNRCQKDLNICTLGEQWPGIPALSKSYDNGCFASFMKGEVRFPAAPAEGCKSKGHTRMYKVCFEHDDFLKVVIGGDKFEYFSEEGPTKSYYPYKQCRNFALHTHSEEDIWLPIRVWYSGTGINRYSHLKMTILPLQKCTINHYKVKKEFCEPCTGANSDSCCQAVGPCDLRYFGNCELEKKEEEEPESAPTPPKHTYPTKPKPKPVETPKPKHASCIVGGDDTCATVVAGKGFSDGSVFAPNKKDEIHMCCKSFLQTGWKNSKYWKPLEVVVWSVANVEYSTGDAAWLSIENNEGEVHFDHYSKPKCQEAILKLEYQSMGLPVGEYSAKIFINSRDKNSGEWDKESDEVIEVHLIVVDPPTVEFKTFEVNKETSTVDFVATIDASDKTVFIPKEGIKLIVGEGYDAKEGDVQDVHKHYNDIVVKGWVPIKDPFECQNNPFAVVAEGLVKHDYKTCGKVSIAEKTQFCYPPTCRIYAVDAAYCGGEGLVTDKHHADFLLVCTQEPVLCKDCFTVHGPHNWKVEHFSRIQESNSSFYLHVTWDKHYYGPIDIGITPADRYQKGCSLDLQEPYKCSNGKEYFKIADVEPISLKRVHSVGVHPLSYKVLYDCDGQHCDKKDEHYEGNPYEVAPNHHKPDSSHYGHDYYSPYGAEPQEEESKPVYGEHPYPYPYPTRHHDHPSSPPENDRNDPHHYGYEGFESGHGDAEHHHQDPYGHFGGYYPNAHGGSHSEEEHAHHFGGSFDPYAASGHDHDDGYGAPYTSHYHSQDDDEASQDHGYGYDAHQSLYADEADHEHTGHYHHEPYGYHGHHYGGHYSHGAGAETDDSSDVHGHVYGDAHVGDSYYGNAHAHESTQDHYGSFDYGHGASYGQEEHTHEDSYSGYGHEHQDPYSGTYYPHDHTHEHDYYTGEENTHDTSYGYGGYDASSGYGDHGSSTGYGAHADHSSGYHFDPTPFTQWGFEDPRHDDNSHYYYGSDDEQTPAQPDNGYGAEAGYGYHAHDHQHYPTRDYGYPAETSSDNHHEGYYGSQDDGEYGSHPATSFGYDHYHQGDYGYQAHDQGYYPTNDYGYPAETSSDNHHESYYGSQDDGEYGSHPATSFGYDHYHQDDYGYQAHDQGYYPTNDYGHPTESTSDNHHESYYGSQEENEHVHYGYDQYHQGDYGSTAPDHHYQPTYDYGYRTQTGSDNDHGSYYGSQEENEHVHYGYDQYHPGDYGYHAHDQGYYPANDYGHHAESTSDKDHGSYYGSQDAHEDARYGGASYGYPGQGDYVYPTEPEYGYYPGSEYGFGGDEGYGYQPHGSSDPYA